MKAKWSRRMAKGALIASIAATVIAIAVPMSVGRANPRPPAATQPATASGPASQPATMGAATTRPLAEPRRIREAKIKCAMVQISMLETALAVFEVDCGRYPTNDEGLGALVKQPANSQGWKKDGYLAKGGVPDDPWGHPYKYVRPGQHNPKGFDLYSFGPDGMDGTADDIGNWDQKAGK
jgi:type II secretion system protein G